MARSTQSHGRSIEDNHGEQRASLNRADAGNGKAEFDAETMRQCANFPGTSRARWNKWPILPNVGDFDSPLSTQMCIQQQVRNNPHDIDAVVNAPKNFDENSWKYEYIRQFCGELNCYVARLAASNECTEKTCPTMQAGTWQYLILLNNGSTRECTATDYVMVTLDQAARQLNNSAHFPSRVNIKPQALNKLNSLCRRLYRIFSHAFYHHRSFFNAMESETSLCRRFTRFVSVYKLTAADTLIVPIMGENVTSEQEAEAMEKQNVSGVTAAPSINTPESSQKGAAHAEIETHTTSKAEGKANKSKPAVTSSHSQASNAKPAVVSRTESNSSVKQHPPGVTPLAVDTASITSSGSDSNVPDSHSKSAASVAGRITESASKAVTGSSTSAAQQHDPAKRRLTYEPGGTNRKEQVKASSSQQQISATIKVAAKKHGSVTGSAPSSNNAASGKHSALKNQKSTPGSGSQEGKQPSRDLTSSDKTQSGGGNSPTKVSSFEKPILYLRKDGDVSSAVADAKSADGSDSGVGDSSSGSSGKNSPEQNKATGRDEELNESEA